jgi:hypothetical protein
MRDLIGTILTSPFCGLLALFGNILLMLFMLADELGK